MFFNRYQVTLVLVTKPCSEPSLLDVSVERASQTTALSCEEVYVPRCLRQFEAVLASLPTGNVELVPMHGTLCSFLRLKHPALRPASVSLLLGFGHSGAFLQGRETASPLGLFSVTESQLWWRF